MAWNQSWGRPPPFDPGMSKHILLRYVKTTQPFSFLAVATRHLQGAKWAAGVRTAWALGCSATACVGKERLKLVSYRRFPAILFCFALLAAFARVVLSHKLPNFLQSPIRGVVLSTQNDDVPATEILRVSANLHSHQSTIDSRTPPRASGAGTSEKLAARQRKQARIFYHLLRRARSLSSTISHQEVSAV